MWEALRPLPISLFGAGKPPEPLEPHGKWHKACRKAWCEAMRPTQPNGRALSRADLDLLETLITDLEPPPVVSQVPMGPRLALSISEACGVLGVSHDFWHEHIAPDVRIVRRGRRKLVPTDELRRWLDSNAERALP